MQLLGLLMIGSCSAYKLKLNLKLRMTKEDGQVYRHHSLFIFEALNKQLQVTEVKTFNCVSRWLSEYVKDWQNDVYVVDPSKIRFLKRSNNKMLEVNPDTPNPKRDDANSINHIGLDKYTIEIPGSQLVPVPCKKEKTFIQFRDFVYGLILLRRGKLSAKDFVHRLKDASGSRDENRCNITKCFEKEVNELYKHDDELKAKRKKEQKLKAQADQEKRRQLNKAVYERQRKEYTRIAELNAKKRAEEAEERKKDWTGRFAYIRCNSAFTKNDKRLVKNRLLNRGKMITSSRTVVVTKDSGDYITIKMETFNEFSRGKTSREVAKRYCKLGEFVDQPEHKKRDWKDWIVEAPEDRRDYYNKNGRPEKSMKGKKMLVLNDFGSRVLVNHTGYYNGKPYSRIVPLQKIFLRKVSKATDDELAKGRELEGRKDDCYATVRDLPNVPEELRGKEVYVREKVAPNTMVRVRHSKYEEIIGKDFQILEHLEDNKIHIKQGGYKYTVTLGDGAEPLELHNMYLVTPELEKKDQYWSIKKHYVSGDALVILDK